MVCILARKIKTILSSFFNNVCQSQICNLACLEHGVVVVTVYATLGHDSLVHALNLTGVGAVFTSADLVGKVGLDCFTIP